MPIARLAPGVALVTVPGRGLAVRTPDGEFLRVDTGDVPADALGLTWDTAEAPGLGALTEAFADAGYLAEPGAASGSVSAPGPVAGPPRLAGRTVLVVGDPVLTAPLLHLLRDEGGDARFAREADVAGAAAAAGPGTAVVWCLDAPVPPGAWDAADRLPDHGVAWLRCHREGATAWIEPLAVRPGDVTAHHVRLRRLAATPAHRELDAYWAGSRTEDTGPRHGAASAALTAALLTAALLEWAAGDGTGGGARILRRIDLRDLTVTEHTVLPVPEVAPIRR
ncbi:hypothetical protein [Streptomyces sp. NPDC005805]|uniref:hypothetical protein n=1 Tax=Streptomyces sp. NPDC005805 TaxID=3157068 RepID=UPI0033E97C82